MQFTTTGLVFCYDESRGISIVVGSRVKPEGEENRILQFSLDETIKLTALGAEFVASPSYNENIIYDCKNPDFIVKKDKTIILGLKRIGGEIYRESIIESIYKMFDISNYKISTYECMKSLGFDMKKVRDIEYKISEYFQSLFSQKIELFISDLINAGYIVDEEYSEMKREKGWLEIKFDKSKNDYYMVYKRDL